MPSDITAIVTYYNQSIEGLIFTLESCIRQVGVSFDIVIADDCSNNDITSTVKSFFKQNDFSDYAIVRQEQNLKTVGNIRAALQHAKGRYIMTIGADDAFYGQSTLSKIVDFCQERKCRVGFGKYMGFEKRDDDFAIFEFDAPLQKELYIEHAPNRVILKEQLDRADWVPGGAQFFQRDLFETLLWDLEKSAHVLYCEDFAMTLALIEPSTKIEYLDEYLVYYEVGVGISTSTSPQKPYAMYQDHTNLYKHVRHQRPYGMPLIKAQALFDLRKIIALHTPIYSFLRKHEAKRRTKGSKIQATPFLLECKNAAKAKAEEQERTTSHA